MFSHRPPKNTPQRTSAATMRCPGRYKGTCRPVPDTGVSCLWVQGSFFAIPSREQLTSRHHHTCLRFSTWYCCFFAFFFFFLVVPLVLAARQTQRSPCYDRSRRLAQGQTGVVFIHAFLFLLVAFCNKSSCGAASFFFFMCGSFSFVEIWTSKIAPSSFSEPRDGQNLCWRSTRRG